MTFPVRASFLVCEKDAYTAGLFGNVREIAPGRVPDSQQCAQGLGVSSPQYLPHLPVREAPKSAPPSLSYLPRDLSQQQARKSLLNDQLEKQETKYMN